MFKHFAAVAVGAFVAAGGAATEMEAGVAVFFGVAAAVAAEQMAHGFQQQQAVVA